MTEIRTYSYVPFIKSIGLIMERNVNKLLKDYDITQSQGLVLSELNRISDPDITMKELENIIGSSQQATAALISRMEAKGYVSTFTDSNDHRVKRVKLTDMGSKLCLEISDKIEEMESIFSEGLKEEDQEQLTAFLETIYNNCRGLE